MLPNGHASSFLRALLAVCLPHAAVHWGDALPFCELLRALVLLPPPLGPQLARVWLSLGALPRLIAYVIGECALELPPGLGEPIMTWARPERGAPPPRTTAEPGHNEGAHLLIEPIAALMIEAQAAARPVDGGGGDGDSDDGECTRNENAAAAAAAATTASSSLSSASTAPSSGDASSGGIVMATVVAAEDAEVAGRQPSALEPPPSEMACPSPRWRRTQRQRQRCRWRNGRWRR